MEPSLSPILLTLGLVFTSYEIIVQSYAQKEVEVTPPLPPPPPPPSPPPPLPSPPPKSPRPPATPPPPERPPPPTSTPPPSKKRPRRLPSPNGFNYKSSDNAFHRRRPPPKKHERSLNTGKKIGLLFAGIAAILQIGVVGFLVFKRRQLLKINNRYETYSS